IAHLSCSVCLPSGISATLVEFLPLTNTAERSRLTFKSYAILENERDFKHMTTTTYTPIDTEFEVVIGLEVHSQLLTRSKMFCECSTKYANTAPNSHVCPVSMG